MPIRFRCAYCNQLMGISHRKVGTVVRCPKCSGQVVVPQVDTGPPHETGSADPGAAMKLLEGPELEMLLAGAANESPEAKKAKRKGPPQALLEIDVEPVDFPPLPTSPESPPQPPTNAGPRLLKGTVTMPGWVIGGVATMILLLLGLIFLVGFLLGKQAPK